MAAEANPSLLRQHAAVILARQQAMREVKRQRQKQGLRETLPYSALAKLSHEWLDDHPELIAEAAASPIVRELGISRRKREPKNQAFPLCKSHERNEGGQ
jgi:hypothetical protein